MTKRVAVAGIGEIGRPIADILAEVYDVLRIDLTIDWQPEQVSVLHVCYPYQVEGAFADVTRGYITQLDPELTIVHSTVRPGTTGSLDTSEHPVCYSPVRGKHARMREDLLVFDKFVSGREEATTAAADAHLSAAGFKVRRFGSVEGLELAKLLETTYFGLLIAWAQEIDRFATQQGADGSEIWSFFDEVDYLPPAHFTPGHIGGHCVIPNTKILDTLRNSPIIDAIWSSNDKRAGELGNDV